MNILMGIILQSSVPTIQSLVLYRNVLGFIVIAEHHRLGLASRQPHQQGSRPRLSCYKDILQYLSAVFVVSSDGLATTKTAKIAKSGDGPPFAKDVEEVGCVPHPTVDG